MVDLSDSEAKLLRLITDNPFATQQELAEALGVARSTIAAQVAQLVQQGHILGRGYLLPQGRRVLCVGGATFNHKYTVRQKAVLGTSNPAGSQHNFGGVARNVAENLVRLGVSCALVSAVGDDEAGRALTQQMRALGCDVSQVAVVPGGSTAVYAAVLDHDHDLLIGIADMDVFDALTPQVLGRTWPHLLASALVFADCNLPQDTLADLLQRKRDAAFSLALDTVSVLKARRLPHDLSAIDVLFTNRDEALAVLGGGSSLTQAEAARQLCARGARHVVLTDGARGVVVASAAACHFLPSLKVNMVDASGAGDGLIAGTLQAMLNGADVNSAVKSGLLVAALTVESAFDVNPLLGPALLDAHAGRLAALRPEHVEM